MASYPIFGPFARPVGEPPLDPPDDGPDSPEAVWSCATPILTGHRGDGSPIYRRCWVPLARDAHGVLHHVHGEDAPGCSGPSHLPSEPGYQP